MKSTVGALRLVYPILEDPYYSYSILYPKYLLQVLRPILGISFAHPRGWALISRIGLRGEYRIKVEYERVFEVLRNGLGWSMLFEDCRV